MKFILKNIIIIIYNDVIFSDSLMLCFTRPIDELVKPELSEEWEKEIFPKFFVLDPKNIDQCRQPGLFKEEAVINHGSMGALRKLSYMHS